MEAVDTPRQVLKAAFLLWASLFLSIVEYLASSTLPKDAFDWVFLAIYAGAIGVNAYIIFLVLRRAHWARTVLLVITVAVVAATVTWPPEIGIDPWWQILLLTAGVIADTIAMIWLFTGSGSEWFQTART